ncbi:MAG TPA: tyrosine-protein phosphatase [Candidatus Binatia bacterium]|nr:tyrosine-protein phosphatase [Candidatus Binatia bacterium]
MDSREVALSAAFNVRDLGGLPAGDGWRVRRGRAYRADALHRLTPPDRAVMAGLGIRRVFDLRSEAELARDGIGEFAGRVAEHVHVPLVRVSLSPFDPDIDWKTVNLRDRYLEMLHEGGAAIRAVFSALAADTFDAVVFHCSGGKDRTGVVAALVLRSLGVPDATIVEDYSLSEVNLAEAVREYRAQLEEAGLDSSAIAYLTSSPPERMLYTLAELDRRWGSTDYYLQRIGVDGETLDRLRRNLLEAG